MTRRLFSGALAASATSAAAPAPAIRSVEIFPVIYPVTGYFKFFPKPERPAVFVKITCQDGTTGWGQSVPTHTWSYETPESVTSTLRAYLAPALIGRNPTDIAGAHALMNRAIAPSFSTGMPLAKAGIDLALHDIAGKLAGKSLPELWGRKPIDRIVLSWTVNVKTLGEAEALMEDGRKLGYRHINIKIAPDPKFDLELAAAVRRFSKDCFLWADANGGYDTDSALTVAPRLKDIGVNVLEQPVAPNRLGGLAALKKQGALPIILDEGVVSVTDLEEFHKLALLDGVAMKPARTAGLWDARKQVEYLERNRLMFLGSGLTDPDLSLAASLLLYGAYGLKYPAALNGLQFLAGSFLKVPFRLEDGAIRLPSGPGLGVEVDEEKVRRESRG
ncbi:MAG: mandelate racemase [Candidatus Solibacter usitatus]|nr:mandelate racemase [Candidatus Solibacter usitatus]